MARRMEPIGFNFGNLRAIGSTRFWWYFLSHIFKIKNVYTFQTKKTALNYLYSLLSFSVHNFCARTDGRTDRHLSKKFYFFLLIKTIYTCLYLSRLFLKCHPPYDIFFTKVSIPYWERVWKLHAFISIRSQFEVYRSFADGRTDIV